MYAMPLQQHRAESTCRAGWKKGASPARSSWPRPCLDAPSQNPNDQSANPYRLEELNQACQEQLAREQNPNHQRASPCRLEELNEARQEQLARVKLVEREREGLEGDKQQAEAYLQKEQECLRAQSTIFLKFIWTAQVGHRACRAHRATSCKQF